MTGQQKAVIPASLCSEEGPWGSVLDNGSDNTRPTQLLGQNS